MRIADDPPIDLRAIRPEDLAFLDRLHETLRRPVIEPALGWDSARERDRLRAQIRLGQDQLVVLAGREVGILALSREPHRLWLRRIQLDPPVQGKGIGTLLLRFVLAEGARLGLPVFLRVRRNNPACRLYRRLGFQVTGEADGEKLEMTAVCDKL